MGSGQFIECFNMTLMWNFNFRARNSALIHRNSALIKLNKAYLAKLKVYSAQFSTY